MIDHLITQLRQLGSDPDEQQLAEIIWLAQFYRVSGMMPQLAPSQPNTDSRSPSPSHSLPQPPDEPQHPTNDAPRESVNGQSEQGLYPPSHDGSKRGGRVVKVAGASPLPDALNIGRALRPLRQRWQSPHESVFDEHATVHHTAHAGGNLTPIVRPITTRWFAVDLVLDTTPSMAVWRETILEFRTLLVRQGAFRHIRTWILDTSREAATLYANFDTTSARQSHELCDGSGRRLILLFSDCVAPAWQSGAVQQQCLLWGKTNPLTLVQMLPTYLWDRSVLGHTESTVIAAQQAGGANTALRVTRPLQWDEDDHQSDGMAIPVMTLDASALHHWALVLTGKRNARTTGVWFDATPVALPSPSRNVTPEQRIRRFYNTATKTTQYLAGLLSYVPVTLPIIRLVQAAMLPQSGLAHVAEFLLSGLIRVLDYHDDPESVFGNYMVVYRRYYYC